MKLKLCFSALCAAAVILLASPAAYADSYDLSLGSISIDSTASGQTVVQNGKTAVDQAPVITQKSAEATQNTISDPRLLRFKGRAHARRREHRHEQRER